MAIAPKYLEVQIKPEWLGGAVTPQVREYIDRLERALDRTLYLAEHLLQQVPEFTGVVVEGHKEDDYIREGIANEFAEFRKLLAADQGCEE